MLTLEEQEWYNKQIHYETCIRFTNKNNKIVTEIVRSENMDYDEEGNEIPGSGKYDIGITGDGYPSGKEKDCKMVFVSSPTQITGYQANLEDLKRLESMVLYRIGKKPKNL